MQLTAPTTVAAALAPLKKVQTNLKSVLSAQKTASADAASAMRTAETKKAAADAEVAQAEALIAKLGDFLGETSVTK